MKDRYLLCYLSGRSEDFDGDVDVEKIGHRIMDGAPFRETIADAAKKALAPEMTAAIKMQWLKDNLDEVKAMGSDTERAWKMYTQGKIDALQSQLEDEVIEEINEHLEDDVDEEDSDEDDDEDNEEEEDEDA